MAEGDAASELRFETTVDGRPTWIAAVARGVRSPQHPRRVGARPHLPCVRRRRTAGASRGWPTPDGAWSSSTRSSSSSDEHGHFAPATRDAHFGDFVAVLDEARSFYRRVAESADR